jgi:predicted dehydrogenase
METAQGSPVVVHSSLAVHGRAPALADRLTIIGSTGTIELEGNTLRCFGPQQAELTYDMAACYSQSYASVIAHFVANVGSGAAFETGPDDNLRTLALVEDIYGRG